MNKTYCDLCGEPGRQAHSLNLTGEAIDLGDRSSARINVAVHFNFFGHTNGYGGPPDLCSEHQKILLKQLMEKHFPD